MNNMKKGIEKIAREDGRYSPKAVQFVYDALGYTAKNVTEEPEHITGPTLCEGIRKLALENWGMLAKLVLNSWGIKNTRDMGEIVYLLIENKWMSAQPTDNIDDFNDIYDLQTTFKKDFEF